MPNESANGILEDLRIDFWKWWGSFRIDFRECWGRVPNKGLFLILLGAWLALFHFVGNATLGYINTPSLLSWMHAAYASNSDANGSDDTHGKVIPLVVLGLFWWKRKQLVGLSLAAWWPGLLLVGLALGLHLVGYMVQQPKLSIVALFAGVYGLMGLAWGRQWLQESFFPFCLFVFCVPLGWSGQAITVPLQMLVCAAVGAICHNVLAIDVLVQGSQIIDPTGRYQYEVAAACSGMHSLIATVAVAVIYAMVGFRSWWRRGILLAVAAPLAVLGNVVRMLTIVVAAEFGGQQWGITVHEGGPMGIYSLLPYVPAFGGLMLIGHWLRERPATEATQT
jgi:exosortase